MSYLEDSDLSNHTSVFNNASWNFTDVNVTFPNGINSNQEYLNVLKAPSWFMMIIYIMRVVSTMLSLFGNSLTIIAVAKYENLQTCASIYFVSLAVADFISALHTPFFIVYRYFDDVASIFIPTCLLAKCITTISSAENVHTIFLIGVDRLIYLAYPLKYPMLVTKQRIIGVVLLGWVYNIISLGLFFILTQHLKVGLLCKTINFIPAYATTYFIVFVFSHLLLTFILYLAIARIALKQKRAIMACSTLNQGVINRMRANSKLTIMMSTVIGVYVLAYAPNIITSYVLLLDNSLRNYIVDEIFSVVFWVSIWANPIVYAWQSKEFKMAFMSLLRMKSAHQQQQHDNY